MIRHRGILDTALDVKLYVMTGFQMLKAWILYFIHVTSAQKWDQWDMSSQNRKVLKAGKEYLTLMTSPNDSKYSISNWIMAFFIQHQIKSRIQVGLKFIHHQFAVGE